MIYVSLIYVWSISIVSFIIQKKKKSEELNENKNDNKKRNKMINEIE